MKHHSPRISIVTPSFNQGIFLEECIKSVIIQGYDDLEYIIIDGGSTDNSLEVIRKYEKHLSTWISAPDNGQSDAINKGFKMATGEIVGWLNSDDFYLPGAFGEIVDAYSANPKASFYYGNGYRVDRYGKKINEFYKNGTVRFQIDSFILGLNYILQPASFINRGCLDTIGYLDEKLHYGMDSDLWARLARQVDPEPILACLAASREYRETKTSQGSFERIEELRKIAEKQSEYPMTPGVLLYFMDALHGFVGEEGSPFPKSFQRDVENFWEKAGGVLKSLGVGPDGIPLATVKKIKQK